MHADNAEVLPLLADKSVAHVICDPPYSEHVHGKLGAEGRNDGMKVRAALTFSSVNAEEVRALGAQFGRIATRWIVCFGDERTLGYWLHSGLPWVRAGAWEKPDAMPQMSGDRPASGVDMISIMHAPRQKGSGRMRWNGGGKAAVWRHNVVNPRGREDKDHPTPKPIGLMMDLVADFTDPDDVVLDPFAGSGTTGVACLRLGRRCILIEKDATYAAVATERLQAESQGLTLRDARAGQQSLFTTTGGT